MTKPMIKLLLGALAFAFALVTSAAHATNFLKIEGIDGDVTAAGYENQVEASTFQFALHHVGNAGSGAGAVRLTFTELTFTKPTDKASVKLFMAAATGEHIKQVVLSVAKSDKGRLATVVKYTLHDVVIASYAVQGGSDRPQETVALSFAKIEIEYGAPGGIGPNAPAKGGWDLQANRKL
jgi:type VI secretion system secreted protein Hcp